MSLIQVDPDKRLTAEEALHHPVSQDYIILNIEPNRLDGTGGRTKRLIGSVASLPSLMLNSGSRFQKKRPTTISDRASSRTTPRLAGSDRQLERSWPHSECVRSHPVRRNLLNRQLGRRRLLSPRTTCPRNLRAMRMMTVISFPNSGKSFERTNLMVLSENNSALKRHRRSVQSERRSLKRRQRTWTRSAGKLRRSRFDEIQFELISKSTRCSNLRACRSGSRGSVVTSKGTVVFLSFSPVFLVCFPRIVQSRLVWIMS